MIQIVLAGLPVANNPGRFRRRALELSFRLARAERRNRMLVRDLAGERDHLARALLLAGLRLPVVDAGPLPRGPGVRSGAAPGNGADS